MRPSLAKSLVDTPARGQVHYPAGSIVICNACAKPLYKLDRPLGLGQKAGRGASAFKPIALADLVDLEERADIDAGLRAMVSSWDLHQRLEHLRSLNEPKSGDTMMCPCCKSGFVQVLTVEKDETLDRAYVLELVTVPPVGHRAVPLRGRPNLWVH